MNEVRATSEQPADSPLHGFQGDREPLQNPTIPLAASIAVSREVGARGGEVARRLGMKLGWPVYDAEKLGYNAQSQTAYDDLLAELPDDAEPWIESRMNWLHKHHVLSADPDYARVSQLILALGAKGEAIFVGRGAGFILPRESTLHVRFIAPLDARIAYMSQWLRLPYAEASEQVQLREVKRSEFLAKCFHLPSDDIIYDLVLNSSALGEELCTDLTVLAIRAKRTTTPTDMSGILV